MARDLEEEQLAALKSWWERQGTPTVMAVVLAVGGYLGYRGWQNSVAASGEAASAAYEELAAASDAYLGDGGEDQQLKATLLSLGETIKTEHEGSAYAVFAALRLARLAVEADDLAGAAEQLGFALVQYLDPPMEALVRMRLARVQIAQGQPEAALETLASLTAVTDAQRASVEEVRGDAHQALGETGKARIAYRLAVRSLEAGQEDPMLLMKLADLPAEGAGAPAEDGAASAEGAGGLAEDAAASAASAAAPDDSAAAPAEDSAALVEDSAAPDEENGA